MNITFLGFSTTVFFYIVFGFFTGLLIDFFVYDLESSNAEVAGLILFWPLFVIKYLFMGIWAVLTATGAMLF